MNESSTLVLGIGKISLTAICIAGPDEKYAIFMLRHVQLGLVSCSFCFFIQWSSIVGQGQIYLNKSQS